MEKKLAKERGRGERREMDILWHYSLDFSVWKRGLPSAAVCSISCLHLAKGNFFNALIFTQIAPGYYICECYVREKDQTGCPLPRSQIDQ